MGEHVEHAMRIRREDVRAPGWIELDHGPAAVFDQADVNDDGGGQFTARHEVGAEIQDGGGDLRSGSGMVGERVAEGEIRRRGDHPAVGDEAPVLPQPFDGFRQEDRRIRGDGSAHPDVRARGIDPRIKALVQRIGGLGEEPLVASR